EYERVRGACRDRAARELVYRPLLTGGALALVAGANENGCNLAMRPLRRPFDRRSLLADPERLEGHDHARRVWSALPDRARRYRWRRPVQARLPCDQPEQSNAGDHRSRAARWWCAAVDLRIGGDSRGSRREDREIPAEEHGRQVQGAAMGVLADGKPRSDDGQREPLQELREESRPQIG